MTKNKLSARKDASFKKPSSFLHEKRVATVFKKAFELTELCDVGVCIIWYDCEGNFVKAWPENNEAKVRDTAERYSRLSEQERNKKSTNLSGFLNKKMIRDKEESIKKKDNRFLQKVSEFKDSLQSRFQTFQESLNLDHQPHETPTVLSLVNVDHQPSPVLNYYPSSTESHADLSTTTTSSSSVPSKFSILLYNHDNGMFTQLANSSSFEQLSQFPCNPQDYGYMGSLLGEQGMRGCNNFDLPMSSTILPPPLMQTKTPNFQQFMQTQQGYNQMLF